MPVQFSFLSGGLGGRRSSRRLRSLRDSPALHQVYMNGWSEGFLRVSLHDISMLNN